MVVHYIYSEYIDLYILWLLLCAAGMWVTSTSAVVAVLLCRYSFPISSWDLVQVLDGVMFNKDVTHSKMRRKIEKPRILLLDCPLEYKKGEVSKHSRSEDRARYGWLLPPFDAC